MFNNELVPMTRRYPDLAQKVLKRDSKFVQKLVTIWDESKNADACFDLFLSEKETLSPERYWELLRSIWILCGTVYRVPVFRKLFTANKRSRYYFSTPEEQAKLRALPFEVKVYRATNEINDGGLSWTLSKEYAEKYKTMFDKRTIITQIIDKPKIFAYIDRNLESEILIL